MNLKVSALKSYAFLPLQFRLKSRRLHQSSRVLITARARSTRESNVFTGVCLSTGGGAGTPGPFREGGGGTVTGPIQSPVPGPV